MISSNPTANSATKDSLAVKPLRAPTMRLVRPGRATTTLARLVLALLVLAAVLLVVTPWQQTADGTGRVIAFAPTDRQQNIEAPIEGRVVRWYVHEGSHVDVGDPIVDLSDNDPQILVRLHAEREAQARRIEAARERAKSIEARLEELEGSRTNAVSSADARTRMAQQRLVAAQRALDAANATQDTARLNLDRQRALLDKGLASKRTMELAELDAARAVADVDRAQAAADAAKDELASLRSDVGKVGNDGRAAINDARAGVAAAEGEVAAASAELARIEVRLARQASQAIVATRKGVIFRIVANAQHGEIVKAGDQLAVLVPETQERAVEIWLRGNDVPLVHVGQVVRLQFEGWPALQFSGWPAVAVGTFGGRVALIDPTDNGKGDFRILVVPDEQSAPWPSTDYLRQGVRANGWVLLGRVRLGFELWRQFNGFPPSVPREPNAPDGKGAKEGKPAKDGSSGSGEGK